MKLLERYYTPERLNWEVDARALENFVMNPSKHVFIIWGDIGIGKSWFVRYHLEMLVRRRPGSVSYGVVDMLRASPADAQEKLQQQIIKIIGFSCEASDLALRCLASRDVLTHDASGYPTGVVHPDRRQRFMSEHGRRERDGDGKPRSSCSTPTG